MPRNIVAAFQEATASPVATLFMLRMWYWHNQHRVGTMDEHGIKWIANSIPEWVEETGLTADQIKHVLKVLKAKSLITTKTATYRRRHVLHVALTGRAILAGSVKTPPPVGGFSPDDGVKKHPPYIEQEEPTGETQEKADTAPKIGPVTGEQDMPPYGKKFSMADVAEGTAPKKPRLTLKAQKKAKSKGDLAHVWKDTMGEVYKDFVQNPTLADVGMLGHFLKDTDVETAAHVIETCIRNWVDFALKVAPQMEKGKPPSKPVIPFLVKHRGIAINFTKTFKAPVPVKTQPKKSPTQPVAPGTQPDYKHSAGDTPAQLEPGDFFGD